MTIVALGLGAAYAAILWLLARNIAQRRQLSLGNWPHLTIAFCGIAAASVAAVFPPDVAPLLGTTLIGTIVCATVDARTGLIFDLLSLNMAVVAIALGLWQGHLADGVLALLLVGSALLTLYLSSGGRGFGFGDVKLGAALALGYGTQLSVLAIGSAFVIGAGYAGLLLGSGRAKRSDTLHFGPFIAGGAIASLTANVLGYRW